MQPADRYPEKCLKDGCHDRPYRDFTSSLSTAACDKEVWRRRSVVMMRMFILEIFKNPICILSMQFRMLGFDERFENYLYFIFASQMLFTRLIV